MPGVRRIHDSPARYLVTWTHRKRLDDCEMAIVEMADAPLPGELYCRTHEREDCAFIQEVRDFLERQCIGGEEDGA